VDEEFGCGYCADAANRHYGHVTQIGTHSELSLLLIRCPRCHTLYEMSGDGGVTTRLTGEQAATRYPAADLPAD
jgi:hypothetical protein